MPGLLDYLYPQGYAGGLLGMGSAASDFAEDTRRTRGLLEQGKTPREILRQQGIGAGAMHALGFAGITKPIRAYHGSPHNFDKFDASKIGTGEGAQAYGRGLYFAENPAIARHYREQLATPDRKLQELASAYDGLPPAEAIRQLRNGQRQAAFRGETRSAAEYDEVARWIEAGRPPNFSGHMYEVNIHADPQRMLDWDAPLFRQPRDVRRALHPNEWGAAADRRQTGGQFINRMQGYGDDVDTSSALQQAGIPGIRYLDAGSRTAGDGSRNYVIFDPSIVEIVRKYGLLGPTAVGGGLLGVND